MSSLNQIAQRHGWDRWKDIVFIGAAALLIALSIGAVTSQGAGKAPDHQWTVTMVENPDLAK